MTYFVQPGRVSVVCDGQFGSTGKGLLAAYLRPPKDPPAYVTTNAGPNSGHTTMFKDGRKIVCYHLPTMGVLCPESMIYLNAGSIINVKILMQEIRTHDVYDRIAIHPNATIITPNDLIIEKAHVSRATKIASTQKGVGAALARKVRREAMVAQDEPELRDLVREIDLNWAMKTDGCSVVMEIPQGYSLSLNSQFYPHVTSRQCTVAQGLADAQISPRLLGRVAMAVRTYPIRVGAVPDAPAWVGSHSGSMYPDQAELTWEEIGQEPERTTVTGRIRRVFSWSWEQYREALLENDPDIVFLNFCNYVPRQHVEGLYDGMMKMEAAINGKKPDKLFGYGPHVEDIRSFIDDV